VKPPIPSGGGSDWFVPLAVTIAAALSVAYSLRYAVHVYLGRRSMAARVPLLPAEDQGLLRAGALLPIAVFALKAALLPLHLWLPRTYTSTSPPDAMKRSARWMSS
jgi:formate hydrogenlyase subunit 3/multisubunit Na+/H+ antiporter MnhD subunit